MATALGRVIKAMLSCHSQLCGDPVRTGDSCCDGEAGAVEPGPPPPWRRLDLTSRLSFPPGTDTAALAWPWGHCPSAGRKGPQCLMAGLSRGQRSWGRAGPDSCVGSLCTARREAKGEESAACVEASALFLARCAARGKDGDLSDVRAPPVRRKHPGTVSLGRSDRFQGTATRAEPGSPAPCSPPGTGSRPPSRSSRESLPCRCVEGSSCGQGQRASWGAGSPALGLEPVAQGVSGRAEGLPGPSVPSSAVGVAASTVDGRAAGPAVTLSVLTAPR